jgi:hypothetical protein
MLVSWNTSSASALWGTSTRIYEKIHRPSLVNSRTNSSVLPGSPMMMVGATDHCRCALRGGKNAPSEGFCPQRAMLILSEEENEFCDSPRKAAIVNRAISGPYGDYD